MNDLTLVVRRRFRAARERVYAAWTRPELVVQWWGPAGVTCPEAELDVRVGGTYRIANRFEDGALVWLGGVFEVVEPPERLVYTWVMGDAPPERVTVQFVDVDGETEVVVRHERVATQALLEGHEAGWLGCLDGLHALVD